jgi:hypothetical protein
MLAILRRLLRLGPPDAAPEPPAADLAVRLASWLSEVRSERADAPTDLGLALVECELEEALRLLAIARGATPPEAEWSANDVVALGPGGAS